VNPVSGDATDRGMRHVVIAGAARLEPEGPGRDDATAQTTGREWPKRGGWRSPREPKEGAVHDDGA
jgi:hypothetical protein